MWMRVVALVKSQLIPDVTKHRFLLSKNGVTMDVPTYVSESSKRLRQILGKMVEE